MSRKKKSGVIGAILKAIVMFYVYLFKGIFWIFKGIGIGIKKLIECILKLPPEEQHKLAIGVQWLFSLVFVVAGFFGIFSSGIAMIFMIILGLILNPKLCNLLNTKLKNKNIIIDAPKRVAIGVVSLVLMCVLLPKEAPKEIPTELDTTQETISSTKTIGTTIVEELSLGFSFDDSLYEKIFKEIYLFGYDEEVSVDTKKKMNVANKYDISVSEVTEIINYFKDGKNKDISYIVVGNPFGTTIATTTIATTQVTTTFETTVTTIEKETESPKIVETVPITNTYVLNISTMKFHKPSCRDVEKISPENYATFEGSRNDVIVQGYDSCGHCNP